MNSNLTLKPKLNLSPVRIDDYCGRRTFFVGFYVSLTILLLLPLTKFSADLAPILEMAGIGTEGRSKVAEAIAEQRVAAWVCFLLGAGLPLFFIARRNAVSKIFKGLALLLIAPSVLVALGIIKNEGSASNFMASVTIGPTIWAWFYLAAQICCVIGILKLGLREDNKGSMALPE